MSYHPTKFGGRRHCAREDILILVCHMTSRDYFVREPRDIILSFPCYSPFERGYIKLSICHMTSCDHIIRGSCYMGEFP